MTAVTGRAYLVGAFLTMLLLAEGTALGAAVPTVTRVTGVDAALVGQLALAHGIGALLGILLWGRLQGRAATRRVVAAAVVCMLLGGVAVVVNPAAGTAALAAGGTAWLLALAVALLVVGVGFGLLMTSINTVAAQLGMSPGMLNALHGTFGVGAIGFPVLVGRTDLAAVFVVVLVGLVVAWPLLHRTPTVRRAATSSTAGRDARPFVVFIALAVSLEIGISVWAPTHLVATGRSVEAAAAAVGAYFAAFTASRFLVAPFVPRWDLGRLVRWCMLATGVAAVAATVAPTAAWVAAGVGIGPMFPTTLSWMARATGDDHAATRLYTGAMVGGLVSPALLGVVLAVAGPDSLPVAMGVLAAIGWIVARSLPEDREVEPVTAGG